MTYLLEVANFPIECRLKKSQEVSSQEELAISILVDKATFLLLSEGESWLIISTVISAPIKLFLFIPQFFDNYDEEITGGLDFEEIEGFKADNGEVMKQILAEHKKNKELERQKPDFAKLPALGDDSEDEEGAKPELEMVEVQDPREKWDCESILSTYSNIYHHPKLISEPSKKVITKRY